jgi:hypothetical protein
MIPEILKYATTMKLLPSTFNYCEELQLNIVNGNPAIKTISCTETQTTRTVEPSDPDEICCFSTTITETIEPSDPDEYLCYSTIHTDSIEPSDPDEITAMSTVKTATLEPSDPDEFLDCDL